MFHGPLTFRHHFLHDYWIKSKFRADSYIQNRSLYVAVSSEFFIDPIIVEIVGSEGQRAMKHDFFYGKT